MGHVLVGIGPMTRSNGGERGGTRENCTESHDGPRRVWLTALLEQRCREMSGGRRPLASVSGGQVEDLLHRAVRLADRVAVVRRAGKVRVRESDAAMSLVAENVARRRFAADAEEESGLRIHVCVTPAI